MTVVRVPAVAGSFYPGQRLALEQTVRELLGEACGESGESPPMAVPGCLVPHAGYQYSGRVAASVYRSIRIPDRCVLLGPNHTGRGPRVSVSAASAWETPAGRLAVDTAFADGLVARCPLLIKEDRAHASEHALEVQLPFLSARNPHVRIVPLTLFPLERHEYEALADALCGMLADDPAETLCIVSSDMTHYEPRDVAEAQDARVLDDLRALDVDGLQRRVRQEGVSMCGFAPASVALLMAQRLGWRGATVTRYATSGEVTGDFDSVVGYAGVTFT